MSNTAYIQVDIDRSDSDAAKIANAAQFFQADSLDPIDNDTTLYANAALHTAFDSSQSLLAALGEAMDKEVSNIRSVGATFEQYDHMLADLAD